MKLISGKAVFLFYLVPEFTLLAFSSALEVLRLANQVAGRDVFEWKLVSEDGEPVTASCGLRLPVDLSRSQVTAMVNGGERPRMILVCTGRNVRAYESKPFFIWLRNCRHQRIPLGALCTGSHLLARAGLLQDKRCTIHWENHASLAEIFPDVIVSRQLFEIDDGIYTCAGGTASLEMMLHLIAGDVDAKAAGRVSELAIVPFLRDGSVRQRFPMAHANPVRNPYIRRAIDLMEDNITDVLSIDSIADSVGLSRRQMERLFRNEINCPPSKHYFKIRLERAREFLEQTDMNIVDIAVACGFISASHFSKAYRSVFGKPPHQARISSVPVWTSAHVEAAE